MRLLLISNSTNAGEAYLEYPKGQIADFLAASARKVDTVLFVPYAAVTFGYDEYRAKVAARFGEFGVQVDSVHRYAHPAEAVRRAQAIVVGGGNTFHLAKAMQDEGLYEPIRQAVLERGVPYIGWSAGSNMSCPTICTTNDMPIVEPLSFRALNLVPFQINPHYLDAHPDGHAGETREMRIEEFLAANKGVRVAGLREGCMLRIEGERVALIGSRPLRLFRYGEPPCELEPTDNLIGLM